jgi:hypothetical protein
MTLFGETIVLLTNYHLFCFSDFAPNPEARMIMGYSLIATTIFGISVYLVLIIKDPTLMAISKSKLIYVRRRNIQKHLQSKK